MAVRNGSSDARQRRVLLTTWNGLLTDDTGSPLSAAALADKSVHVYGAFGTGGTVVIEGSNNNGASWLTLNDALGNPLSFTAEAIASILENVQQIRPRVSAGDGSTNLSVAIIATPRF